MHAHNNPQTLERKVQIQLQKHRGQSYCFCFCNAPIYQKGIALVKYFWYNVVTRRSFLRNARFVLFDKIIFCGG